VQDVLWVLAHIQLADIVDILLVAVVFYVLFSLARGTAAVQLLRGMILVVLAAFFVSQLLPFKGFGWLIRNSIPALLISIPVIFQPELRRGLERLGRAGSLFVRRQEEEALERMVDEVTRAVHRMAGQRHGALIVFERETGLQEFVESGVLIDAEVKAELLRTIFHPNTALHDKAVIVRDERIVAANCMLPTTHNLQYSGMGTRHRAAIGVTEESDALALVVSEETGIVSVAHNGRMVRRLDTNRLRSVLQAFFQHRLASRTWAKRA
jgi:diadenylate cyclase